MITKTFGKGLSKNFEKVLSKRFETFSKVKEYAKHTPTLRKPKFRFSNDGYGTPYPDTPSRGVTREGYAKHTPTLRKPKYRLSIGVITRGKYGLRLIENIKKNSDFKVSSIELPASLPDFIETPEDFVKALDLDMSIFSNDLVIAYTLHPDLTPEIARLAGENGARAVIIAGGIARAGGLSEIQNISEKYNMHVEVHEICCDIEKCGNNIVDEFASCFGRPKLRITTTSGLVSNAEVIRGAPCGSTWHAAKGLVGISVKDVPARAGLLVQQYPCRALRGIKGGIHKAAELHKNAVKKALEEE